jgi:hypothetical protein
MSRPSARAGAGEGKHGGEAGGGGEGAATARVDSTGDAKLCTVKFWLNAADVTAASRAFATEEA